MEYLMTNASEIMQLCFGAGFLILMLALTKTVLLATKILRKVNDVTDLVITYINKPLNLMVQVERSVGKFLQNINK